MYQNKLIRSIYFFLVFNKDNDHCYSLGSYPDL